MSARMELHVALSLRLDAIEAYRLANAYRAEVVAERDAEIIAWLGKKAREFRSTGRRQHALQADAIYAMASKITRGAVRADNMLGADPGETPAPVFYLAEYEGTTPALFATVDAAKAHCAELITAETHGRHWDWIPDDDGTWQQAWTDEQTDTPLYAAHGTVTPMTLGGA